MTFNEIRLKKDGPLKSSISILKKYEKTVGNVFFFFANLHFFAEVLFWCEFYTFGAPFSVSGWILGGHLKKCTSFWVGARGPKGYQNETREALKAKRELSKNVKNPWCVA